MVQGTGSDVGKSTVVAGLCRAFTKRGLTVRPFKPQNMSNNAAVTLECGEIGRAQALQARACGVPPSTDMNPVLLKPQTDVGSQVVVRGRVWKNVKARDYYDLKPELMPIILESYARLGEDCDLVVIEGAGSPAEVNLRDGDVANMGFALAAGTPVVLVADIDRGGVIANIVGTHALLTEDERQLLLGYIVNKTDDRTAIDYLVDGTSARAWRDRKLNWLAPQARTSNSRNEQLSDIAVIGLANAGTAETLKQLQQLSDQKPDRKSSELLKEAIRTCSSIHSLGLRKYCRKKH